MSKTLETRLRRKFARHGLRLQKNPHKHWTRYFGEGYQVVDDVANTVVYGCFQREFECSLQEVADFSDWGLSQR